MSAWPGLNLDEEGKMKKNLWLRLLLIGLFWGGGGEWARAESAPFVYRSYVQPTPQELPSDYEYRTARVFAPSPAEPGGLWSLLAGKKDPAPTDPGLKSAENGLQLRLKVRELARQLLVNVKQPLEEETITMATFVNLGHLYKTSSLGRCLTEQMLGEFQAAGLNVLEVRKSVGMMIREGFGEYSLSRDMGELSYVHAAQVMLVGTYTVSDGQLFLAARLLRNSDGLVVSSAGMVFPLDSVTAGLLADEATPRGGNKVVSVQTLN